MINELFASPIDYARLTYLIEKLCEKYPTAHLSYIGNSLLSRQIPMLRIGEESAPEVFYIAGHHGCEWLCSGVLLALARELCELSESGGRIHGISAEYLLRSRSYTIIPQLNVDGTDIAINGISEDCPTYARLCRAIGEGGFSLWQANARGVDLNHNYDARFYEYKPIETEMGLYSAAPSRYSGEYPESEPESAAVANYIRYKRPRLIISLHSQGEVIYGGNSSSARSREIAARLSALCAYPLSTPEGAASYGGLCDWAREELGIPSFTFECGLGSNPLPLEDGARIYARVRGALLLGASMV